MKVFFEEYGLTILLASIIGILILMATPIGERFQVTLREWTNGKYSSTQTDLNNKANANAEAEVEIDDRGNVTISVNPTKEGEYLVEYSYKRNGIWSDWSGIDTLKVTKNSAGTFDLKVIRYTNSEILKMRVAKGEYIRFRISSKYKSFATDNILFDY